MKEKGKFIMLGALFGAAFVICLLLLWKICMEPLPGRERPILSQAGEDAAEESSGGENHGSQDFAGSRDPEDAGS